MLLVGVMKWHGRVHVFFFYFRCFIRLRLHTVSQLRHLKIKCLSIFHILDRYYQQLATEKKEKKNTQNI